MEEGEIIALVGPNGSGKTTILNLISGVLKPDSGEIFFSGQELTSHRLEVISNLGVSRLFQQSRLFENLTVMENLLLALDNNDTRFLKNLFSFGQRNEAREQVAREMLSRMNMGEFENEQTKRLSYGQKRLVEIIRTMLKPHKLLLLDEPVAGVTPALRNELKHFFLQQSSRGDTILLAEHDLNFVIGIADRIVVLKDGRIVAQGDQSVLKSDKMFSKTYLGG